MKRDMDLIRQMVLAARGGGRLFRIEGVDADVFAEHVALLIDAGLVEGRLLRSYEGTGAAWDSGVIERLTWAGQEFAKSVEDGARWAAARDYLVKQGGVFTLDLLLAYLKGKVIG